MTQARTQRLTSAQRPKLALVLLSLMLVVMMWAGHAGSGLPWVAIGVGWASVIGFLIAESWQVRLRVGAAMALGTLAELVCHHVGAYRYTSPYALWWASALWGLYLLLALYLTRNPLLRRFRVQCTAVAATAVAGWALWGQPDVAGIVLAVGAFALLWWGVEPLLFVAAFVVAAWVTFLNGAFGTWAWHYGAAGFVGIVMLILWWGTAVPHHRGN